MEDMQIDLINKLIRRTNCIEEKIDLIVDGVFRLPAWADGSVYRWDNFGKKYAGGHFRRAKRDSSGYYKSINS